MQMKKRKEKEKIRNTKKSLFILILFIVEILYVCRIEEEKDKVKRK